MRIIICGSLFRIVVHLCQFFCDISVSILLEVMFLQGFFLFFCHTLNVLVISREILLSPFFGFAILDVLLELFVCKVAFHVVSPVGALLVKETIDIIIVSAP